jgi:hypothetical protein
MQSRAERSSPDALSKLSSNQKLQMLRLRKHEAKYATDTTILFSQSHADISKPLYDFFACFNGPCMRKLDARMAKLEVLNLWPILQKICGHDFIQTISVHYLYETLIDQLFI